MSKIKIFALGGLNENGKNMYVVEVDENIFVFDAGLKYPTTNMLGVDYIIPKFDYLIKNNTKKDDIVLDLFAGSGTSIIACEQNGRIAYSMELDPKYVDVIISRWEKLTGQQAERIENGK